VQQKVQSRINSPNLHIEGLGGEYQILTTGAVEMRCPTNIVASVASEK
jgi:hypothetical protein